MPGPVSATLNTARPPASAVVTVTTPPGGVCRTALVSRLVSTWISRHRVAVELDVGTGDRHRDLAARRRGRDRCDGVDGDRLRRHRFAVQRQPTGVTEGERAEVLDEPVEGPRLVAQDRQVLVVAPVDAVELSLDAGLQHGQRCAQLVGDVGEESAAGRLGRLEPRRPSR